MNTAAVARHLNVAESAIVRVEEWAHVLFVVVKGLGARFVSKKVVKVEQIIQVSQLKAGDRFHYRTVKDGRYVSSIEAVSDARETRTGFQVTTASGKTACWLSVFDSVKVEA